MKASKRLRTPGPDFYLKTSFPVNLIELHLAHTITNCCVKRKSNYILIMLNMSIS